LPAGPAGPLARRSLARRRGLAARGVPNALPRMTTNDLRPLLPENWQPVQSA